MKILSIPAKAKVAIIIPEELKKLLPLKVGLVSTIQHLHKMEDVKKQIEGSVICGQILGCNTQCTVGCFAVDGSELEGYLFIGSGLFHPIAVALNTGKPVFKYNPFTKGYDKVEKEDIEKYKKKKRISLTKYFSSEKIGILVSIKSGQENMKKALELKEKGDKEYYIFGFETLSPIELENFPFIECWVNTACPRIQDGKSGIVNINDVLEYINS